MKISHSSRINIDMFPKFMIISMQIILLSLSFIFVIVMVINTVSNNINPTQLLFHLLMTGGCLLGFFASQMIIPNELILTNDKIIILMPRRKRLWRYRKLLIPSKTIKSYYIMGSMIIINQKDFKCKFILIQAFFREKKKIEKVITWLIEHHISKSDVHPICKDKIIIS